MVKKIISIIFTFILVFSVILTPVTVNAYEPTGIDITAKAGMLISLDTGEMLYSNNIDAKVYPASIAKIMTAVLMLESDKYIPTEKIAMTKDIDKLVTGTGLSVSNLKVGEEITHKDLLYTVLMSSFGDCTYLAAIHYGGTLENFVDMMNAKAAELGLTGTHYSNPVGLHEEETYTTVRDIYTLSCYALKNEIFKEVCESSRYTIEPTNMHGRRVLSSTNFLQDNTTPYFYQYAKGVKTGYTNEAGRCLVSTARYNGYNYMCILMNCTNNKSHRYDFLETRELYRWAFNNFSFKEVASSTDPICEIPLELSLDTDFVSLYFEKPFVTVLPNEADESTIVVKTHLKSDSVNAPIKKGDVLGTADIIYAEKVIGTVNLVANNNIKDSKLLVTFSYIKSFFSSIYMKIVYALIALAIVIFIIMIIRLNIARLRKRKVKYIPYGTRKGDRNEH